MCWPGIFHHGGGGQGRGASALPTDLCGVASIRWRQWWREAIHPPRVAQPNDVHKQTVKVKASLPAGAAHPLHPGPAHPPPHLPQQPPHQPGAAGGLDGSDEVRRGLAVGAKRQETRRLKERQLGSSLAPSARQVHAMLRSSAWPAASLWAWPAPSTSLSSSWRRWP